MRRSTWLVGLFVALAASPGCRRQTPGVDCVESPPVPGEDAVCTVPGFDDRDFILRLPSSYAASSKSPLVLAFHGGGGQKEGMNPLTCRDGDLESAACLSQVAEREGFAVAYPDGTDGGLGFRTWNQGGKRSGLACPYACEQEVDDVAYVRALLDEIARVASVDPKRVYATGFSNGAGMSHRLACELSDRIAAIAPVGGANQFALVEACEPVRPVPVLQIHGTADPCWPYEGGSGDCVASVRGSYAGVEASTVGTEAEPGWAVRNGCSLADPELLSLPDLDGDGRAPTERRFQQCEAEVVLLSVDGAGHTWPGGDPYLAERRIGRLSLDFDASERVWTFLRDKRLP